MSLLAAISSSRRRATSVFSPLSLSPSLWLDASDASTLYDAISGGNLVAANGLVARWQDKSGNSKHATQGTPSKQPMRKIAVKAGLDAIRLDGTADTMQVSMITLPTFISVFVVQSCVGNPHKFFMEQSDAVDLVKSGFWFNGVENTSWGMRRISPDSYHFGASFSGVNWTGTGWSLAEFLYNGVGTTYKNGVFNSNITYIGTAVRNENTTDNLNIGSRGQSSLFLNGDLGEILIYPSALSSANRASVEAYLMAKWLS